jgi:hypothetical protein
MSATRLTRHVKAPARAAAKEAAAATAATEAAAAMAAMKEEAATKEEAAAAMTTGAVASFLGADRIPGNAGRPKFRPSDEPTFV